MEAALIKLLSGNPEPWQIAFGVAVLAILIVPKLVSVRESWIHYRQGMGKLKRREEELELLKLQYEIEGLKKTHGLQDIDLTTPTAATFADVDEGAASQPSSVWLYLVEHPILAEIVLGILHIFTGLYLFTFGLLTVAMPFVPLFETELELEPGVTMNVPLMAVVWAFYLVVTYLLYRAYRRIKLWKLALRSQSAAARGVKKAAPVVETDNELPQA